MKTPALEGTVLTLVATATCLFLGTFGWFAIGFGTMTDCTNNYDCTDTGCPPCATTERWITFGGLSQLALAGIGVVVLLLGHRAKRGAYLFVGGAAVLGMSVLTVVSTTLLASESYCQPGTPGYTSSYCSTDD